MEERRKQSRVPVVLNATYLKKHKTEGIRRAFSRDISQRGACLLLKERLQEGSSLALNITLSEPTARSIRTEGHVVWQREWSDSPEHPSQYFLTGVRFASLNGSDLAYLTKILSEPSTAQRSQDGTLQTLQHRVLSSGKSFPAHMTLLKNPPVRITAVASYLPDRIVDNQEVIESGLQATDATVRRALGAVERRAASESQSNAEMMVRVAKEILQKAGRHPSELDRIICSSDPQDAVAPNVAAVVQRMIDATCPAYDVQMSCAGWFCGVDIASRCIATGEQRILVLASSLVGSRLFFHNRMHRAIFGDAAAGVLLETSDRGKILSVGLWTDGRYYDKIYVPLPWSQIPASIPEEYRKSFFMSPNQEDFFATMDFYLLPFSKRLWDEAGVSKEEIDCFLLHQPSMPLFEYSLKALDVPREKAVDYFGRCGNIVAAEPPFYLDEAIRTGRIREGDTVFALTYGAGFTMGGMVFRL